MDREIHGFVLEYLGQVGTGTGFVDYYALSIDTIARQQPINGEKLARGMRRNMKILDCQEV